MISVKYLFLLFIVVLFSSCLNQESCQDITSVPVRMSFHRTPGTQPTVVSIDSLTIYGLGNDSIIYNNQKNVRRVELPLDSRQDSCAYVFEFPALKDTVWFFYQRDPVLISMECGFVHHYQITEVRHTGHFIASTEIIEESVTSNMNEHIKIYPAIPANN
jgi:hypothetical protein